MTIKFFVPRAAQKQDFYSCLEGKKSDLTREAIHKKVSLWGISQITSPGQVSPFLRKLKRHNSVSECTLSQIALMVSDIPGGVTFAVLHHLLN